MYIYIYIGIRYIHISNVYDFYADNIVSCLAFINYLLNILILIYYNVF